MNSFFNRCLTPEVVWYNCPNLTVFLALFGALNFDLVYQYYPLFFLSLWCEASVQSIYCIDSQLHMRIIRIHPDFYLLNISESYCSIGELKNPNIFCLLLNNKSYCLDSIGKFVQ